MQKKKILMLCDHPLSTSGVGTQSRYLISKLIATGKYSFRVLGGAIKHDSYETVSVNPDFIVKPVDGFGGRDVLRLAIATEQPDAIMLFTDPRFFIWVWEMEDEIHQVCPIVYNHLWDQCEFPPVFNKVLFESTDLINCINRPTYEFLHSHFPEKTHWAPHALPTELFFQMPEIEQLQARKQLIQNVPNAEFLVAWVNRNARRKMPGDLIWSWKMFLDALEKKHGHRNAALVLHTDPHDQEGPNLLQIIEMFKLHQNVIISNNRTSFQDMNKLYNSVDTVINRSCAEGFGLSTLEAMYCGKPIIALQTGGLTRQVVDYRDGSENGIALPVELKSMVGSQMVPYILEDHVRNETVADAFMKMYELGPEGRKALGQKAKAYALEEFSMDKLGETWDKTLEETIANWRSRYSPWESVKL